MDARTADTRRLRKFGFTVGGVFTALAIIFILRHKHHVPYYVSIVAGPDPLLNVTKALCAAENEHIVV